MEQIFLTILNRSIAAGWLILAVIVLRWVLKKAPKNACLALWAIAAVRLALPAALTSRLSLIPKAETIPAGILLDAQPAIDSGITAVNEVVNPMIAASFTPDPAASANPLQILVPVLAWLWLLDICGMLLYAAGSWLHTRYRLREAVPFGKKNVLVCDQVTSPFIFGVLRPKICLPSGMDETQLAPVLAHEQAHLRRGDHVWKMLGFLLLAVYWFHPLVWAAYVLFCRDLELACDERVVRGMSLEEKKVYSRALLECSLHHRIRVICPLAFGEVGVKMRIRAVLHYKKPAFWAAAAAAAVCLVTAVCFLTNPGEAEAKPDLAEPVQAQPEAENADSGSPEAVMDALMDMIVSSPAESSNPGDYIQAHLEEYRQLCAYGDDALRYIFAQFLKGGETGLRGHILKQAMIKLIGEEAIHLDAETGQAYFDHWRADSTALYAQKGAGYMQAERPKAWLLMQMIDAMASDDPDALPAANRKILTAWVQKDCMMRDAPDGEFLDTEPMLRSGEHVELLFSAVVASEENYWYQVQHFRGDDAAAKIGWIPADAVEIAAQQ